MSGIFSLYLKETLVSSIPPESLVITSLPSEISGTVLKKGCTVSRIGFICATVSAIPARDINAPETIP